MSSTDTCIAVFCGLPGSGKTSICELVRELAVYGPAAGPGSQKPTVVHVCYDEIIPQLEIGYSEYDRDYDHQQQGEQQEQDKNSLWKEYRRQIVTCVDHILGEVHKKGASLHRVIVDLLRDQDEDAAGIESQEVSSLQGEVRMRVAKCLKASLEDQVRDGGSTGKLIILVDDNMFYRSMRYEYYQLARKYSSGFCQIGILCSAQTAIARNCKRADQIPEETIVAMATKMEVPDASKASWEKNSVLIDAAEPLDHPILETVWMRIQSAFLSPVPPLEEEDLEAKEHSRATCAASLVHQSDQVLRKCISDIMASYKDKLTKDQLRGLALRLNSARTALLEEIRHGSIMPPSLPQDSDSKAEFHKFLLDRLQSRCEDVL